MTSLYSDDPHVTRINKYARKMGHCLPWRIKPPICPSVEQLHRMQTCFTLPKYIQYQNNSYARKMGPFLPWRNKLPICSSVEKLHRMQTCFTFLKYIQYHILEWKHDPKYHGPLKESIQLCCARRGGIKLTCMRDTEVLWWRNVPKLMKCPE